MGKTITLKVTDAEYNEIKQYADERNMNVPTLVLDCMWAAVEHWEDVQAIKEYEEAKANGTMVTYSLDEVIKELELDVV